jgi:hypothetical protein
MTNAEEIIEKLKEVNESALLADGLEGALFGICNRFGQNPLAAYDMEKIFKIYMDEGMTYDEAVEYFEFNVIGAWVGEDTPVFIDTSAF